MLIHTLSRFRATTLLLLAVPLVFMACDKKADADGGKKEGGDKAAAAAESPKDLGAAAAKIYVDTVTKVTAALEKKPSVDDARKAVTELLDAAKKSLVEIGKKREAMKAGDRSNFDRAMMKGMRGVSGETFSKFGKLQMEYQKQDSKLGTLIAEANIITQYAAFELLKKQKPEEAKKYGIK